ncbi:MAG TPA: hypothetical protein VHS36_07825 [Candidatus Limnocylindrales bacterium]|nr:hypothetical protein [Candidatus Limnocylindrales bacterium]
MNDHDSLDHAIDLAIERTKAAHEDFVAEPTGHPSKLPLADRVVSRAEDLEDLVIADAEELEPGDDQEPDIESTGGSGSQRGEPRR